MRASLGLVLGLMVVVGAACGEPENGVRGQATDSLPSPAAGVDVDAEWELCPTDGVTVKSADAEAQVGEIARLEPTLRDVADYGKEHPDQFAGYELYWDGPGDASVIASFSDELARHYAALTDIVENPDDLIVCRAPVSATEAQDIRETIVVDYGARVVKVGSDSARGNVEVYVRPNEEQLAADLVDRYGDALDVKVGALKYPIERAIPVCGSTIESTPKTGLDITLAAPDKPVAATSTGSVELTVRLKNTSESTIEFDSAMPASTVTDRSGTPTTSDVRVTNPSGVIVQLEPGATRDVAVDVSLASCDPSVGYMIGDGDHYVVVTVGETTSLPLAFTIAG